MVLLGLWSRDCLQERESQSETLSDALETSLKDLLFFEDAMDDLDY